MEAPDDPLKFSDETIRTRSIEKYRKRASGYDAMGYIVVGRVAPVIKA